MRTGPNGEKFTETAFLVLLNRVVSLVFSMVLAWFSGESLKPSAPLAAYVAVSVGNFLATFCQYEALKYVTFPTQTLGKCAKMIPVLIIGSFYHKKMYSWHEYAVALLITIGCTTFLTTGVLFRLTTAGFRILSQYLDRILPLGKCDNGYSIWIISHLRVFGI